MDVRLVMIRGGIGVREMMVITRVSVEMGAKMRMRQTPRGREGRFVVIIASICADGVLVEWFRVVSSESG